MKRTLLSLTLALVGFASQAGVIAEVPNNAGGFIRLTDSQGKCSNTAMIVFSNNGDTGRVSTGCWFIMEGTRSVIINWHSGNASSFEFSDFNYTDYYVKTYEQRNR